MTIQERILFFKSHLDDARRKTMSLSESPVAYEAALSHQIELEKIIADLEAEQNKLIDEAVNLVGKLTSPSIFTFGWGNSYHCKYRRVLSKARARVLRREIKDFQFNAGELAQPSPDSLIILKEISPAALPGTATYSQTLLDGVYDVVASGVAKVKAKFSKRVDSSPPPVQLTIFDVLRDWAKSYLSKLKADYFAWLAGGVFTDGWRMSDGSRLSAEIIDFKRVWGL